MRLTGCSVVLIVLGVSSNALALKPGIHAEITKDSCRDADLPSDFCLRAATENYNTDAREWEDMRAHAQIDGAQTRCVAADGTVGRIWDLGVELRVALFDLSLKGTPENAARVASALGRTLHTIQDNCAHHGMPNPQHAWFSISDFCDGTKLSPDEQDGALACARAETDAVMAVVAIAVEAADVASDLAEDSCTASPNEEREGPRNICRDRFLPSPIAACEFLAAASDWDGTDRQWENSLVVPALNDAFAAGVYGEPAPAPICGDDQDAIAPATSAADYDVSGGPASCKKATLFCLGKADEAEHPFADDEPSGGCSTAGGRPGAALWFLCALLLVGVSRRRR